MSKSAKNRTNHKKFIPINIKYTRKIYESYQVTIGTNLMIQEFKTPIELRNNL